MESIIWMGWHVSIIENTTLSFPPFLLEMACKVLLSEVFVRRNHKYKMPVLYPGG